MLLHISVTMASMLALVASMNSDGITGNIRRLAERDKRIDGGATSLRENLKTMDHKLRSGLLKDTRGVDNRLNGHANLAGKGATQKIKPKAKPKVVEDPQIIALREKEAAESDILDKEHIELIKKLPSSDETRVVSFSLYGEGKTRYTVGAVENAKIIKTYFPGWVARFYLTGPVDEVILNELKELGAEFIKSDDSMFARFLVASDDKVDRYIIRDADARLSARDRFAVEDWIQSGKKFSIIRDHMNHCHPMNGGMWGGVKGAVPNMAELMDTWRSGRATYMEDMRFLWSKIYPLAQKSMYQTDSYCCLRFKGTHPFPVQRLPNFEHVGQVFLEDNQARHTDIDRFLRIRPSPLACRKNETWLHG